MSHDPKHIPFEGSTSCMYEYKFSHFDTFVSVTDGRMYTQNYDK